MQKLSQIKLIIVLKIINLSTLQQKADALDKIVTSLTMK